MCQESAVPRQRAVLGPGGEGCQGCKSFGLIFFSIFSPLFSQLHHFQTEALRGEPCQRNAVPHGLCAAGAAPAPRFGAARTWLYRREGCPAGITAGQEVCSAAGNSPAFEVRASVVQGAWEGGRGVHGTSVPAPAPTVAVGAVCLTPMALPAAAL